MGEASRRTLNVSFALVAAVVTIPLMIVIALLIKLSSKGPIIYAQTRVGVNRRSGRERRAKSRGRLNSRRWRNQGGRPFTIYKFRTMYVSEQGRRGQVWAKPGDPRITPVGRFLRRYRLDELPQLINVLLGDMNLVGPRPEQPEIFAYLSNVIEHYAERQRVLPGITGWAQVNHHYDTSEHDVRRKVALDLEYIRRRSPAEDLKIMARTVPVMVLKRGAL
ncbi:MAG: sugar transferase [Gemmatimonadota bacterium]|nr:MAG: sugar transferase [Gemmatimonadota bacterium]